MVEWLNGVVAWWHWVVLGLLLALGEMLVPSFFLLLIGISAVIVGLLMLVLDLSLSMQLLIWAVLSIGVVIAWFVFILPRVPDRTRSGMAMEALVGQIGMLNDFNPTTMRGRVRFPAPIVGNDEWSCIVREGARLGERVTVLQISGNDLVVGPHQLG